MKIFKITIENYRLLKEFSIDLEDELSLVIGKNNTGKTSILSILDKFLNQGDKPKILVDDFNIVFKNKLKELLEDPVTPAEADFKLLGIKVKLFIKYTERDNLANMSRVMMDLDPANNVIVLGFEYVINYFDFNRLKKDAKDFAATEAQKKRENSDYQEKCLFDYLKQKHNSYFKFEKKTFEFDIATGQVNEANFINLANEGISIKDIINFKYISARRDVTNKEVDKTLSGQTSRIYRSTEATDEQNEAVEKFKDTLSETDGNLSKIYSSLFENIIKKVQSFGGIKPNESEIEIVSTLQHRELLDGNTTVVYRHDPHHQLPENYNGLGYMNLISMIFEIEILVHEFKKEKDKKPADINLLFVEEPEAHTHPQMQYIFIKNIKKLLKAGIKRDDGETRQLQYIISTHSSHIVADSDFNDIKYLKREHDNGVVAKNLKDLQKDYDVSTPQYQFLKQYLTISRAEIFFADKAILIEGDTERILIPTLMRKVDIEEEGRHKTQGTEDSFLPLLSQNISVIEVGAYSQIFEKFIDFLGIRSLIITDLDAVDKNGEKCEVAKGVGYSNAALDFFFQSPSLDNLTAYTLANKIYSKASGSWVNLPHGTLCIVYQTTEDTYNARSFEDAFIHINKSFISPLKEDFHGLQNRKLFDDPKNDSYILADRCIKKKTHFALDILFHSNPNFDNWKIPSYIKEGLLWLKQD